MSKKHLYLMRHGETLFNVRHRIQGSCDSPLTENGIAQAKEAGKKLEGIVFDHCYSSTAERASDTLEIVTGGKMPYTRLKGIKERDFGIMEGESEDLNPKGEYDLFFPVFYGGEKSDDVSERMKETITAIMEKEDHENVLVVSHAGAMICFIIALFGEGVMKSVGRMKNCAILHLTYEDGVFEFIEQLS